MNNEAGTLARNMSAPPRTTLTFSALGSAAEDSEDAVDVGAGLRFVCRLDPRAHIPERRRQTGADANAKDEARIHRRIRTAAVYARAELAGRPEVSEDELDQIELPSVESLADELLAIVATIPLSENEFPGIGLLLPVKDAVERPIMPGLVRTLAVLSRRRGDLFVRDADPIVWTAMQGEALDLWLPTLAAPQRPKVTA